MKIRIGIDPAFRKNGFGVCIIDETNDIRFLRVASFLDFLRWLGTDAPAENVTVVIENSNMQDATFGGRMSYNQFGARSRDAGKNMAVSQCTVDACVYKWGATNVRGISPKQKGRKWTKLQAKAVALSMGLQLPKKTTQDDIDAFQLAVRTY